MSNPHAQLVSLLREKSGKSWGFTLASGKKFHFYVDVRQTALHCLGAELIGSLILGPTRSEAVGVGGMTLGADPIACSVVALSNSKNRPVHGFIIRKEPKWYR